MSNLIYFMPGAPWVTGKMSGNSIVLDDGGVLSVVHFDDLAAERCDPAPADYAAAAANLSCVKVCAEVRINDVVYPVAVCLAVFSAMIAKSGSGGNNGTTVVHRAVQKAAGAIKSICGGCGS